MGHGIGPQNLGAAGMSSKSKPCGTPLNFVDPRMQMGMQQPQMGVQPQMGAMPQQPGQTPLYNAGTMYLKKEAAKAAGKDTFQVGDKTFPVKG